MKTKTKIHLGKKHNFPKSCSKQCQIFSSAKHSYITVLLWKKINKKIKKLENKLELNLLKKSGKRTIFSPTTEAVSRNLLKTIFDFFFSQAQLYINVYYQANFFVLKIKEKKIKLELKIALFLTMCNEIFLNYKNSFLLRCTTR